MAKLTDQPKASPKMEEAGPLIIPKSGGVHREQTPSLEQVILRDGNLQFPNRPVIKPDALHLDPSATQVTITFNPPSKAKTFLSIREFKELPDQIQKLIIRQHAVDYALGPSGKHDSESAIDNFVSLLQKHPDIFESSLKSGKFLREDGRFEVAYMPAGSEEAPTFFQLSNSGDDRYFWFTPRGQTNLVPARVLDIHPLQRVARGCVNILAEWIPEPGSSENGPSVRYVGMLTEGEVISIRDTMADPIRGPVRRRESRSAFVVSLSQEGLKCEAQARTLGLKTYGYANSLRTRPEGYDNGDPLTIMNSPMPVAIPHFIAEVFGLKKLKEVFGEKLNEVAPHYSGELGGNYDRNILDFMGELGPRGVLDKLESRNTRFQYLFVITEDGHLKLSPFGPEGINWFPPTLRLAHGRRVYAAGNFTINTDGALDIVLNSHYYQVPKTYDGIVYRRRGQVEVPAFEFSEGQIQKLVQEVFYAQSGRRVKSIRATNVESLVRTPGSEPKPPSGPPKPAAKWDVSRDSVPVSFREWVRTERTDSSRSSQDSNKKKWAHYIFGTNSSSSNEDISAAYRKLSIRFHPDRTPDNPRANEVMKMLNDAREILSQNS